MGIKMGKWFKRSIAVLLIIIFCFISAVSLSTIFHMQGNARVINYTGIVRGATQRLIKQEINQVPNGELVSYLDCILEELAAGGEVNKLIALPDDTFQDLVKELNLRWTEIKEEIGQVRLGKDSSRLYSLSEDYFVLADQAVSAAETYSEKNVSHAKNILICLNVGFILLVTLFWIYGKKQKRIQLALDTAENANRAKSQFLSRISHEIRTPMNGIIGMTAIARRSLDDREKMSDCLKKIDLSSGYLLGLINDVLDMSRIESGKVELEHQVFSLPGLLEQIEGMLSLRAQEKCVEFSINANTLTVVNVIGDSMRIGQILVNIITNALKFTAPDGCVTLEILQKSVCEKTVSLEFYITDTGVGISEEFLPKIFEPFEQEYAATGRQYGGTGLGLAICHNFVKMMGGDISVSSKLGEGSTFTVCLTLELPDKEDEINKDTDRQTAYDFTSVRVLLAEDNEINAEIAKMLLEENGAQVQWVSNGRDAVDKFTVSAEGDYTLILMDVQMPVMGGLEASRLIRGLGRPDAQRIPIIGISANAFQEDIEIARKSGMSGYLSKPIDIGKLYENIRNII